MPFGKKRKRNPFVVVSVVLNEKVDLFMNRMLVVPVDSLVIYCRLLLIRTVPSQGCPTVFHLTTVHNTLSQICILADFANSLYALNMWDLHMCSSGHPVSVQAYWNSCLPKFSLHVCWGGYAFSGVHSWTYCIHHLCYIGLLCCTKCSVSRK